MKSLLKFLKKLLFSLFIVLAIIAIAYLGILAYYDANSTRGVNYLLDKYELKPEQIKAIKYQEYVYEDLVHCEDLWIKKCTSEENLLHEYTFEIGNDVVKVKEYSKSKFTDDYKNGTIRKEYSEKQEK